MSFDQFLTVIRAFEHERVEYVLVGGVAVNIHGIVRTRTVPHLRPRDLDGR